MLEVTPKYEPVDQLPYCCVPACLQMVFSRRGLKVPDQKKIGYKLGLAVPEGYREQFPGALTEQPSSGWGTQIQNETYSLGAFLKSQSLPLEFVYHFPKSVENLRETLVRIVSSNDDAIVCFNHEVLYPGSGADWGHVSLVQILDDERVYLVESEKGQEKCRVADLERLFLAMQKHGAGNYAGVWEICS